MNENRKSKLKKNATGKIMWKRWLTKSPITVKELIDILGDCDPYAEIGIAGMGEWGQFDCPLDPAIKHRFTTAALRTIMYTDHSDGANEIKLLGWYE